MLKWGPANVLVRYGGGKYTQPPCVCSISHQTSALQPKSPRLFFDNHFAKLPGQLAFLVRDLTPVGEGGSESARLDNTRVA